MFDAAVAQVAVVGHESPFLRGLQRRFDGRVAAAADIETVAVIQQRAAIAPVAGEGGQGGGHIEAGQGGGGQGDAGGPPGNLAAQVFE